MMPRPPAPAPSARRPPAPAEIARIDIPAAEPGKTAVLLINTGSPDAPTASAARRYLREFLSDPRVVEMPRIPWWFILHGFVLNTRPKKTAERYAAIWTDEGSPLKTHTQRQAQRLRGFLGQAGHPVRVDWAMRYGKPSIAEILARLAREGCARVLLLPLYPQYSAGMSASALDAAYRWAASVRNQPELRAVRGFASDPGYIEALAASVRRHWGLNGHPDASCRLLLSFHGLPVKTIERGDPYREECLETARLLVRALKLDEESHAIAFQSRFGSGRWLEPYTLEALENLARQGVRRVDVLCPGFASDCLETLGEIAVQGEAAFLQAGGREYLPIPCLNENEEWIASLQTLVLRHLQGWPTAR